jgi:hypothetical protein|tara:strand:+ start:414 stop:809 length:396 start_codon:yes stop_codon:yes gene_type:complete
MALNTEASIGNLNFDINFSLQIGDLLYCNPISSSIGGFSTYVTTKLIGEVTEINTEESYIGFNFSSIGLTSAQINSVFNLSAQSFITFKKNLSVNSSSLKGYYALCEFVNNDYNNRNELFSVGSQVSISSK